jgi:hypothetical protein
MESNGRRSEPNVRGGWVCSPAATELMEPRAGLAAPTGEA